MRILMAEDDPNISVIAKLSLEKLGGFDVTVVSDGEEALKTALADDSFDLILLDEMMPKMNGLRVSQEYKAQCTEPKPIIFLSAKSQESDIREFKLNGLGHIAKPFDPMTIASQIRALMEGRSAA